MENSFKYIFYIIVGSYRKQFFNLFLFTLYSRQLYLKFRWICLAGSLSLHAHIIGYACYRPKSLCKKSLINLNLFGKRIVKVTIVNPSRQYTRSHLNAFHTLAIDVWKETC